MFCSVNVTDKWSKKVYSLLMNKIILKDYKASILCAKNEVILILRTLTNFWAWYDVVEPNYAYDIPNILKTILCRLSSKWG